MAVKPYWMILPILLALGCGRGESVELRMSGPAVAAQLQSLLAGSKAHFNADEGANAGCYVQFGNGSSVKRFEFSLPNRVKDLGIAGTITYKINDINLDDLQVSATAQKFVIAARFESRGVELKGLHSMLGDAGVPDIELDDMRLQISLKPITTRDGSITYDDPQVSFTAKVDNTLAPRFSILDHTIDIMDTLTNYRDDICHSIQTQVQRALDKTDRKAALAKLIGSAIGNGSQSRIESLRWEGTDLIVKMR